MEVVKIIRKGRPLFVRLMSVSELDKSKCSSKFLSHNLNDDVIVNVKCFEDGTLDLRGKKEEYRIIVEDSQTKINLNKMGNIEKIDLSICKKGDILISSHNNFHNGSISFLYLTKTTPLHFEFQCSLHLI